MTSKFYRNAGTFNLSDIALVNGNRGYISKLGRKFLHIRIYGGALVRVDPTKVILTGETHN